MSKTLLVLQVTSLSYQFAYIQQMSKTVRSVSFVLLLYQFTYIQQMSKTNTSWLCKPSSISLPISNRCLKLRK